MKQAVFTGGRFQPPTRGHDRLFQTMSHYSDKGFYPIIFIIDGIKSGQDKIKNPLTNSQRKEILMEVTPFRVEIVNTAIDVFDIMDVLGLQPSLWIAGSDRSNNYKKLCSSINQNTEIVSLDRNTTEQPISGTIVRNAIWNRDWLTYTNSMPENLSPDSLKKVFDWIWSAKYGVTSTG